MNEFIRVRVVLESFPPPTEPQVALIMTQRITHVVNSPVLNNKCLIYLDTGEALLVLGGVATIVKKMTELPNEPIE